MANWRVKVKGIRPLLTEDDSDINAIKVGKDVYKILTSPAYRNYFEDFQDLDELLHLDGLNHFNDVLNRMYDYCDAERIWIDFD